jgi:hypothetical protein
MGINVHQATLDGATRGQRWGAKGLAGDSNIDHADFLPLPALINHMNDEINALFEKSKKRKKHKN